MKNRIYLLNIGYVVGLTFLGFLVISKTYNFKDKILSWDIIKKYSTHIYNYLQSQGIYLQYNFSDNEKRKFFYYNSKFFEKVDNRILLKNNITINDLVNRYIPPLCPIEVEDAFIDDENLKVLKKIITE